MDGKWRSLDARPLFAMTVAASEAYNTAFEAELTARAARNPDGGILGYVARASRNS